jgi:indole-3-glycerol phosphate synthase
MGVLDEILAAKRAELGELGRRALPPAPERRPVVLARQAGEPLRLIAEIKRRSPSAGALSTALSVAERAGAYERAGARLISVLTDRHFFDGAYENLQQARASTSLPLLCKDFIIDERQLDAARAYGADAALLIVRCLGAAELPRLVQAARSRELVPFVEVVTEDEAHRALDAGAELIGVNTRDLDTLAMDPAGAERLLKLLPASVTRAQLSGIRSPEAVARVAQSGVDAALIGEALMRADDPEPLLRQMVASAAAPG